VAASVAAEKGPSETQPLPEIDDRRLEADPHGKGETDDEIGQADQQHVEGGRLLQHFPD
jgi:hypothetical protein